ncbi:MAG: GntR family transcriptional regulator [Pseudomonadota bacterium]
MSLQPNNALPNASLNTNHAPRAVYAGPLYMQLTSRLRDRIRHEDWRAGMVIPSESDLAREYQVSVGTARKALEGLEKDGWIVRKQGRGTFVNDLASMQMERLCRFRMDGEEGFDGCVVSLLRRERGQATPQEATRLSLPSGGSHDVIRLRRRYFKDDRSSILEDVVLPAGLFAGLEEVTRCPVNIFSLLVDEFSVIPHRSSEVVSAGLASGEVAAQMRLAEGTPLLSSAATIWDIDGTRVMLLTRHAHARGLQYHVELS